VTVDKILVMLRLERPILAAAEVETITLQIAKAPAVQESSSFAIPTHLLPQYQLRDRQQLQQPAVFVFINTPNLDQLLSKFGENGNISRDQIGRS